MAGAIRSRRSLIFQCEKMASDTVRKRITLAICLMCPEKRQGKKQTQSVGTPVNKKKNFRFKNAGKKLGVQLMDPSITHSIKQSSSQSINQSLTREIKTVKFLSIEGDAHLAWITVQVRTQPRSTQPPHDTVSVRPWPRGKAGQETLWLEQQSSSSIAEKSTTIKCLPSQQDRKIFLKVPTRSLCIS